MTTTFTQKREWQLLPSAAADSRGHALQLATSKEQPSSILPSSTKKLFFAPIFGQLGVEISTRQNKHWRLKATFKKKEGFLPAVTLKATLDRAVGYLSFNCAYVTSKLFDWSNSISTIRNRFLHSFGDSWCLQSISQRVNSVDNQVFLTFRIRGHLT